MNVYRMWWLHDARWYQGVASRFGYAAANAINAEALRFVAVRTGKRVAKTFGRPVAEANLTELRGLFEQCGSIMFPDELRDARTDILGEDCLELVNRQNFAVVMVRMAGSLDGYECPCNEVHAGWAEGLGVGLCENRVTSCLRHGDPACRFLMRLDRPPAADPAALSVAPGSGGD